MTAWLHLSTCCVRFRGEYWRLGPGCWRVARVPSFEARKLRSYQAIISTRRSLCYLVNHSIEKAPALFARLSTEMFGKKSFYREIFLSNIEDSQVCSLLPGDGLR